MHWQKVVPWGWAVWQHNDKGGSLVNPVSCVCTFLCRGNVRDAANDKPVLHLSSHLHGILGCGLHWMIMEMAFQWWEGKLPFPYLHCCPLILGRLSLFRQWLSPASVLSLCCSYSRELQLERRAVPHYADHVAMGFMPVKQFLACLGYFFTSEGIHAS